jgi:hypothetical protein
MLFQEALRLLQPHGLFIVSCRNRLFNIVSISENTFEELKNGTASKLVMELQELFQEIPRQDARNFLISLARNSRELLSGNPARPKRSHRKIRFTTFIEARQHTPKELVSLAKTFGFSYEGCYGIHPHLLMANVNNLLPPNVFNALSLSLESLAHLPVSLIWSSVFTAVFRRKH